MQDQDKRELDAKLRALDVLTALVETESILKRAPIQILHKYFLRCDEYAKFHKLIFKAVPNDVFGDDNWLLKLANKLEEDGDQENSANIKQLIASFEKARDFMYTNKLFPQLMCGYPDPDLDARIIGINFIKELESGKNKQ